MNSRTNATTAMPKAVHFGAGNIGRGFIAPLLAASGYSVVFAARDPAVVDALNTSRGYDVHVLDERAHSFAVGGVSAVPSTGDAILNALADPTTHVLTTAVGPSALAAIAPTIARGLVCRREMGGDVLNVIACENLVGATTRLKELVLAQLPSAVDRAWVSEYVGFADCAVDRIVPPFDAARLSPASSPRGSPEPEPTAPALDVAVEAFHEWAVDGTQLRSPAPRVKGWTRTPRLRAFVERKLYTLNTAHAIAAYRGALAGLDTVGAAIADPAIEAAVRQALAESGAALCAEHGFTEEEHAAYIEKTIQRFRNPHLHDAIARVAREPLRKLARADRLVGPARMCAARGIPARGLLSGVAAALLYDAPDDAQSAQLARDIATKGLERTVVDVTGFEAGGDEVREVVAAYGRLSAGRA